ncbi:YdeI/OmpD-associated family protein [Alteromonadaceae bacterium BrNp21-10]|nr:YdeI/OmpD-associated family protein [Alteromonadaceae bacterium BrNp21-10]
MTPNHKTSEFTAPLLRPAKPSDESLWAFVVLPKDISETLARRGRMTVAASIDGHNFQAKLEPDGQLSHWFVINEELLKTANVGIGDIVRFEITPLPQEPEPEVPADLYEALMAHPEALKVWEDTTILARVDWIHWVTTAKQTKTRIKRIHDACDMLSSGKRRVCCFDPSGFYSKAFGAPKTAD